MKNKIIGGTLIILGILLLLVLPQIVYPAIQDGSFNLSLYYLHVIINFLRYTLISCAFLIIGSKFLFE